MYFLYIISMVYIPFAWSSWKILNPTINGKKIAYIIFLTSLMIGTGFALVSASRGFLFNFVIVFFLVLLNTGQARNWYQSKRVLSRILTVGPLSLAFGFFLVIQGKAYIGVISSFFRGEHSALPELVLDLHPIWGEVFKRVQSSLSFSVGRHQQRRRTKFVSSFFCCTATFDSK